MSKPKRISKLEYLEAERRFIEKNKDVDLDLATVILYELDEEIEEEKRKLNKE